MRGVSDLSYEIEGYSHDSMRKLLTSSTRDVFYEYTVQSKDNVTLGKLTKCNSSISFDSTRQIMWTISGSAKANELLDINAMDERIVPWLCLRCNKQVIRWPLGKYIVDLDERFVNGNTEIGFNGYDLGQLAYDDRVEERHYVGSGGVYTSELAQLLGEIYPSYDITASRLTRPNAYEWEIGTRKINIIADYLNAINYYPLFFTERGDAVAMPYVSPVEKSIDFVYEVSKRSVILDDISRITNRFDMPNKFIRYTEGAGVTYYRSVYENNDPDSPYSIANRGRVILDVDKISDVASQSSLDAFTKRIALAKSELADELVFSTINMPGHGYKNCLFVSIPDMNLSGKYIEYAWSMNLETGGEMTHRCRRVVNF